MKKANSLDIVSLIVIDHGVLRESIDVLKEPESALAEKRKQLKRFIANLRVHAKSEEQTLYEAVLTYRDLHMETLEAFTEHAIATTILEELEKSGFETHWTDEIEAKAKVMAELVEHHAEEEEQEMLPVVRKIFTKMELENLGASYLEACRDHAVKEQWPCSLVSLEKLSSEIEFRRASGDLN